MIKKIAFLFFVSFSFTLLHSQTKGPKKKSSGINLSVSPSVNIPIGDLSSTHWGGMGLTVAPASSEFILNQSRTIFFTYEAGVTYYLGKKETITGYSYKYPGYTFIHGFAGLSLIAGRNLEFVLAAGPALGLYNGNTKFNAGASLTGNYYISDKFSIGSSIIAMKEFGTNTLWATSLNAAIYFPKKFRGPPGGTPRF